jgi:formate-dependent nitrite reductase cytochrome c552 subunit
VHKVPDYVYFNHAVHVNRGVSCVECHGSINKMDEVYHAKPLSMAFCLDCHRNPEERLRPPDKITDLNWRWSDDPKAAAEMQKVNGREFVHQWNVQTSLSCSSCHR